MTQTWKNPASGVWLVSAAQSCRITGQFLCQRACSHLTLSPSPSPLSLRHHHLSHLQGHRQQAGVQPQRGGLLGTTGARRHPGARAGSPLALPHPEGEAGGAPGQPPGDPLHSAVPQVHDTISVSLLQVGEGGWGWEGRGVGINSRLPLRPNDFSSEGFNDWAFMTTHSWGEDPRGEWTLEVENVVPSSRDYGNPRPPPPPRPRVHC